MHKELSYLSLIFTIGSVHINAYMTSDSFVESSVVGCIHVLCLVFYLFFLGGGNGRGFIPAKYMFLSQAPEKVLSWCENRHKSLA